MYVYIQYLCNSNEKVSGMFVDWRKGLQKDMSVWSLGSRA